MLPPQGSQWEAWVSMPGGLLLPFPVCPTTAPKEEQLKKVFDIPQLFPLLLCVSSQTLGARCLFLINKIKCFIIEDLKMQKDMKKKLHKGQKITFIFNILAYYSLFIFPD